MVFHHEATVQDIEHIRTVKKWFDDAPFVLFDGGTGTEIEREGGLQVMDKKGWSCRVNLTHPDIVRRVHMKYLQAGADVIIANTYATNPNVMLAAGFSLEEQRESTLRGCQLAREAVSRVTSAGCATARRPLVAGSLSCHPPKMPEGAEFHRGVWPPPDQEEDNLVRHARLLREGGVDVIFLEMVWDYEHALRALNAAVCVGLPVFAAVCVPLPMTGPHTKEALRRLQIPGEEILVGGAGGVSVLDCVSELTRHSNVIGVNVHHTPLPFVGAALSAVRRSGWQGILGAYPDHGTFQNPHWEALDLDTIQFLAMCEEWVGNTACKCIGGCCGVGPDVIKSLDGHRDVLASAYKKAVARRDERKPRMMLPRPKHSMRVTVAAALFCLLFVIAMVQFSPMESAQTRPVVDEAKCGQQWAQLWYFIVDADSDGKVTVQEVHDFLASRPAVRQNVVASFSSLEGFTNAMSPDPSTGAVSLRDFANVFTGSIVGNPKDPCPLPVGQTSEQVASEARPPDTPAPVEAVADAF